MGVANGTDALAIALRSLGVGPGDEVVMPSFTFYATAEAAADVGATPVFCDVDPDTACVTAETVRAALTAAHQGDRPGAPVRQRRAGARAARAGPAGARGRGPGGRGHARTARRPGSLGDAATFSFFPSKNLPCLGDGGAVVTDSDEVAAQARKLRFHGSRDKVTFEEVGYNSRLDELQAAALRVLLPELDGWTEARAGRGGGVRAARAGRARDAARRSRATAPPTTSTRCATPRADELAALAGRAGRRARAATTARRCTASRRWRGSAPDADLPATEELAATNLALPMGTGLSPEAVGEVVDACASGST